MHTGAITKVIVDRGFGFISEPGQRDAFFHCSDLADGLEFDEQLTGRRLRFDLIGTDRGPQARNVRPAD